MADNPSSSSRDSHDLSLSPRAVTRDSLVANMLLSLDQLSLDRTNSREPPYDDFATRLCAATRARNGRDDVDDDDDDEDDDEEEDDDDDDDDADDADDIRPSKPSRPRVATGASRSLAASASSPPAILAPPLPSRLMRRSASFDHWPSSQILRQLADVAEPPRDGSFSDAPVRRASAADANHDAGGNDASQVATSPAALASRRFPPPPPEPLSSDRRRIGSRVSKSSHGRSRRASVQRPSPGPVDFDVDAAPAPSVGYRKPRERETDAAVAAAMMPPRERPGFFRRVFGGGSSRNNLATACDQQNCSRPPPSPVRPPSSSTRQQHTPQPNTAASPRYPSSSSRQPNLHKKSSFFRRRKKSIHDDDAIVPTSKSPPPVPALDTIRIPSTAKSQSPHDKHKSPTSSLRGAMDPYLTGPGAGLGLSSLPTASPLADITNVAGDHRVVSGRDAHKRGFSPDYEPSPMARIRTVHTGNGTAQQDPASPSAHTPQRSRNGPDNGDGPFLDLDGGSDHERALTGSPSRTSSFRERRRQRREHRRKKSKESGSKAPRHDKADVDPDATIRASKKADRPVLTLTPRSQDKTPRNSGRNRGASDSSGAEFKTPPSAPPSVRVDGTTTHDPGFRAFSSKVASPLEPLDEPEFVIGEPTEDERQKAQNIYDGCHVFIQKNKAAAWMGEEGPVRQRTLQAYMELHDFKNKGILTSLRDVCGRLVLRAETQQVDRILVAFSKRWCSCNPRHGFKATDVVHTICYSVMLLNTDLHVADIDQKMTRSQFVKNTMTTIMQAVTESAPGVFSRPSILPDKEGSVLSIANGERALPEHERVSRRTSFLTRSDTDAGFADECGPLVRNPFSGSLRAWQEQVESVLKSMYVSIRDHRLPLFGAEPDKHVGGGGTTTQQHSLSVIGMLRRTPSVLSRAPSETQLSSRGRVAESSRTSGSRWTSKSRSRPGVGRNGFSSSRTSFDDGNSMWSPAMSSATWSRYSLGRTHGSMSQDSFSSNLPPPADYQRSIGFANALSQSIVRQDEAESVDNATSIRSTDAPAMHLLEDETLELAGPPWIKEGLVSHKRHMDSAGKRARGDRNWTEVFAVIQKGQLCLFSFPASKSARQRAHARNPDKPVGGGNWQDSAVSLGTFNLRQTLATALPPPGYSRTRPHVWALSLPSGAVHLFQAGSVETIREFINTANYWSARLSTHPLVGGISNVEYGWGEDMVKNSLVGAINESTGESSAVGSGGGGGDQHDDGKTRAGSGHKRMSSMASGSYRPSSTDQVSSGSPTTTTTASTRGGKLIGDRIYIAEWTPPAQSLRPCRATEDDQLKTLVTYVKSIEAELATHHEVRSAMLLAFTPRGTNAGKALGNWERKSAYLMREIFKFKTYVECLKHAVQRKNEVYAERRAAQRSGRGGADEGDDTLKPL
ncbi:hypothetical protein CP533_1417 [Ophiocordyceps camponoti-saundersi (nom. inval.)]|nr:hypothetical protein CP533_1417 [Ophiocordyceps camponoti-saundersi (nom. inval.)]